MGFHAGEEEVWDEGGDEIGSAGEGRALDSNAREAGQGEGRAAEDDAALQSDDELAARARFIGSGKANLSEDV